MTWVSLSVAFAIAHVVGDYLVQTDWQARHKARGLAGDPLALRALGTHIATYTLTFLPVLVWIGVERAQVWAIAAAALVALPHLVVDDGRVVRAYLTRVKRAHDPSPGLAAAVDQSFHVVCLWLLAVAIGAA